MGDLQAIFIDNGNNDQVGQMNFTLGSVETAWPQVKKSQNQNVT